MKQLLLLAAVLWIHATAFAQKYTIVKFDDVQKILDSKSETLYVLNFWATWCQPCVKELPYFDRITEQYADEKVEVLLISMDFKSDLEKRLIPFLDEHPVKSTVWFLDETKQNDFIPKVEDRWSGAIPFTLIVRGSDGFRYWKEGQWSEKELQSKIAEAL